jgi:uncharacterized protein
MNCHLYAASVPVFLHYLDRLGSLVTSAEAYTRNQSCESLLDARLAPNMLPFRAQIETAAYFTLRTCFPLAGLEVPPFGQSALTFADLHRRVAQTFQLLQSIDATCFETAASRTISDNAGERKLNLPAHEFLFQYALPNFFFHLTTAYAILRSHGLPLGKEQFDGYHLYTHEA